MDIVAAGSLIAYVSLPLALLVGILVGILIG